MRDLAWSVAIIAAAVLVLSTTAASAQWGGWPGYEPYCQWCYQQQPVPVHQQGPRRHREHKPAQVVHRVSIHAPRGGATKPRQFVSVDEERASIKARVQSFCGRHPKDIACQPTQGEPSTSAQVPKEP